MIDDEAKPDYLSMVWKTREKATYFLRDMKRSHIRNSLQWAMRQADRTSLPYASKDGYTLGEWITAFTVRLLDPELGE